MEKIRDGYEQPSGFVMEGRVIRGRQRLPIMRVAGGAIDTDELPPLEGPLVDQILAVIAKPLRIKPELLLANPDMRILENKDDPKDLTLGASSLQSLRAKNAAEQAFGFKVPDEGLRVYRSLRTIVGRVEEELAKKVAG